ncbi:MAG: hypothetical protein WD928_12755 [Gammaproteobacteria bacterium]
MSTTTDRRRFLNRSLAAAAVAMTVPAVEAGQHGMGSFAVAASTEGQCATCTYWGGMRRMSREGTEVHVKSLGFCNNPQSPNFRKMTSPNTGPMPHWVKWSAIGAS